MELGQEAGTGQEALAMQDHSWMGQEGGGCSPPTSTCMTRVGCTASSGLGVDVFPSSGVASLQLAAPARPGLLASSLLREHRSRCGPALPLLGAAQRCCHQLTAHYYKTLPPGFKRLEESRSGFSWSHSQRSVPLTFETKCPVLKIINGKYDKKINLKKKKVMDHLAHAKFCQ